MNPPLQHNNSASSTRATNAQGSSSASGEPARRARGIDWFICILVLLFAGNLPARAQTNTNAVSSLDYSSFKVIADRNIFDPNRRARIGPASRREAPPSRVDSFALVGVMSYSRGPFAFFDGSSSEYRKVLRPGDSIAGYKVTKIAPNATRLSSSTNEVDLRVGMQMRRENSGSWHLAGLLEPGASEPEVRPAGRPGQPATSVAAAGGHTEAGEEESGVDAQVLLTERPTDTGGTNAEAGATSDNTETDPVLRRLMERRNQEINR